MSNQIRFPSKVIQEESSDEGLWENLNNIKVDDWQKLAKCDLKSHQSPSTIILSDFNFNIPDKARISHIFIEHNFKKESSKTSIKVEPPVFKINSNMEKTSSIEAGIYPLERTVFFINDEINLTVEDINRDDFSISVKFPPNSTDNEGYLFLDFIRVKIEYEIPHYVLSSGETSKYYPNKDNPLEKAVGDEFKYSVYFRNVTGVTEDKQKVEINVPEGLEVVNYYYKHGKVNTLYDVEDSDVEDEFDTENMIWYPSVRGKGLSRLRIVFKCLTEGHKVLNSYNEYAGNSPNFHVDVFSSDFESHESKFEQTTNKWASELKEDEDYQFLNKDVAINVEDVSMEFEIPQEKVDNIKEYFIKWVKRDLKPKTHFDALKGITFKINKGERVGIIGFNGAGKSTLLKLLSGVYRPTNGLIEVNGKIAPLLELGAGFDHNYSGRENVFLNGAILGYSRDFLESKYDEIVEFSELEEFMEIPIKNYSSGMTAKLGFSVATVVNPEILILDEILSVGDVKFQKKSGDKLKSMMGSGTTVLLVSHSTSKIRELCTRAIWLDKGKIVMDGDVDYVCDAYIEAAKKASADEIKNLELV